MRHLEKVYCTGTLNQMQSGSSPNTRDMLTEPQQVTATRDTIFEPLEWSICDSRHPQTRNKQVNGQPPPGSQLLPLPQQSLLAPRGRGPCYRRHQKHHHLRQMGQRRLLDPMVYQQHRPAE